MTQSNSSARFLLLQATFLVLALVVALSAYRYAEKRGLERRANLALESVLTELTLNRTAVRQNFEYHSSLLETLESFEQSADVRSTYRETIDDSPEVDVFGKGFVAPALLRSSVWHTAQSSGLMQYFDFQDVSRFSVMYSLQDRYRAQNDEVQSILLTEVLQIGMDGVVENYQNLQFVIRDFYQMEENLLEEYDKILGSVRR